MSEKGRIERAAKRAARETAKKTAEPKVADGKHAVVYYNTGTKCLVRMIVSMYSLRKVWHGDILAVLEGPTPEWVFNAFHALKVRCKRVEFKLPDFKGIKSALVRKPYVPDFVESDAAVFLDNDTVVLQPLDKLFELPDGITFGTTAFSDWKEQGRTMSGRINPWKPVSGGYEPHKDRPAINTGVFCWKRGSEFVKTWQTMTVAGARHPEFGQGSTIMADEIGAQVLLERKVVAVFASR